MDDKRKLGPSRSPKAIYVIAAIIVLTVVTLFVGMNISHMNQMEDAEQDGTASQADDATPIDPE
ncbi:hypothetical protein [Falsirhodobacter algicola]|uniref:Uncharacterized protein n=1 Tax=Falsirhodobacter algicola TaxID=2692330 RepID=A0A8J8MSI6_9RHOB|nr:hypothetical protein [Falsirhodobacter algicola]QUS35644.1 hypothetical protein GR316_04780 [Falsirhodobacter algicola]